MSDSCWTKDTPLGGEFVIDGCAAVPAYAYGVGPATTSVACAALAGVAIACAPEVAPSWEDGPQVDGCVNDLGTATTTGFDKGFS